MRRLLAVLLAAAVGGTGLALMPGGAQAATVSTTIQVGSPIDPSDPGSLTSARTVTALALTPNGKRLYALLSNLVGTGAEDLAVIDLDPTSLAYRTVVDTVHGVGSGLGGTLRFTADGKRLYVTSGGLGSRSVSVVDTDPFDVTGYDTVLGSDTTAGGMALSPDGTRMYLVRQDGITGAYSFGAVDLDRSSPGYGSTTWSPGLDDVVQTLLDRLQDMALHGADEAAVLAAVTAFGNSMLPPAELRVSPDGKVLYVLGLSFTGGVVTMIDADPASPDYMSAIGAVPLPQVAGDLEISPDGKRLYLQSTTSVSVADVDPASPAYGTVIATVPFAGDVEDIAVAPDGRHLYATVRGSITTTTDTSSSTTYTGDDRLFTVDLDPASPTYDIVTGSIPAPAPPAGLGLSMSMPMAVALAPDGSRAYVSGGLPTSVEVVDFQTSFAANGGTGTMAVRTASTAALPGSTFTPPSGAVFTGWNTRPDGTGTTYAAGDPGPVDGDVTLYAQWIVPEASVAVTLTAPVTGTALATGASVSPSAGYLVNRIWWSPADTTAAPVTAYTGVVVLDAKPGHVFTDTPSVTVDGHPAQVVLNTGGSIQISYGFAATAQRTPLLILGALPSLGQGQTRPGDVVLKATLRDGAVGLAGRTLSFTVDGEPAGTGTTDGTGVATFTVVSPSAGIHSFGVSYAGDVTYSQVEVGISGYAVTKAAQGALVVADPGALVYGDAAFSLAATGGSGTGAVTYSVPADNGVLDVAPDGTTTIVGAGTVTVTAVKAADDTYLPSAPATLDVTVAKAAQTGLAITDPGALVHGGAAFALATTGGGGSGLVSFSVPADNGVLDVDAHGAATILGAGTVRVTAVKAGDGDHDASAPTSIDLTVARAAQPALSILSPGPLTYGIDTGFVLATLGGAGTGVVAYSVPADNGVLELGADGTVTVVGAGTVRVTAVRAGDANFAASDPATLDVTVAARPTPTTGPTGAPVLAGLHRPRSHHHGRVFVLSAAGVVLPAGVRVTGYTWALRGGRVLGHGSRLRFKPARKGRPYRITLTVAASNGTAETRTFTVRRHR